MTKTFAVSQQHYLFGVQTFANVVLAAGGDAYDYALRDRTTHGVIADVSSGASDLGVLYRTSASAAELEHALDEAGLEFTSVISSAPRVALPAAHPLGGAARLRIDDLADYPYVYFEQEGDAPDAFAEEALAARPRARRIAATDRASLSELIAALNGYTITSGVLVGISDGTLLQTVPLESDVTLELGYVTRSGEAPAGMASRFVETLSRNLERYAAL